MIGCLALPFKAEMIALWCKFNRKARYAQEKSK
jgi:hypothetical protein